MLSIPILCALYNVYRCKMYYPMSILLCKNKLIKNLSIILYLLKKPLFNILYLKYNEKKIHILNLQVIYYEI